MTHARSLVVALIALLFAQYVFVRGDNKTADWDDPVADCETAISAIPKASYYHKDGHFYVAKDGTVKIKSPKPKKTVDRKELEGPSEDDALGCSAYVVSVLAYMKWGKEKWASEQYAERELAGGWIKAGEKDPKLKKQRLYQAAGRDLAEFFKLGKSIDLKPSDVTGKEKPNGMVADRWYLFNVEGKNSEGNWVAHTGLLKFTAKGGIEQRHYSSSGGNKTEAWGGLATGKFSDWYTKVSAYKTENVQIWLLPKPKGG